MRIFGLCILVCDLIFYAVSFQVAQLTRIAALQAGLGVTDYTDYVPTMAHIAFFVILAIAGFLIYTVKVNFKSEDKRNRAITFYDEHYG